MTGITRLAGTPNAVATTVTYGAVLAYRMRIVPVPELLTRTSEFPALDHKSVHAYSDFLLRDIGTGDGVEQGAAKGNEFRTSPLWGLRLRKRLMHDGSALSPADAIEQHRNESERSRQAYERLDTQERQALLEFLQSL
jgi:CxxC motif-containing protein (DUF1111 family)